MPESDKTRYVFTRNMRFVFTEIYFPRRAAYQGEIFNALRHGYDENVVKDYLSLNIEALLNEFSIYPALFDPKEFARQQRRKTLPSIAEAEQRISMYKHAFAGWSEYIVNGVFFSSQDGKMYEEATQVIRIMFLFASSFTTMAQEADCSDVLRSMLFWLIARQGRPYHRKPWHATEKARFIAEFQPWPKKKKAFIQQYFAAVAKEVHQWIDDRVLFTFGYLVRRFSEKVLIEKLYEEEIWVMNMFDPVLNVTKRVD